MHQWAAKLESILIPLLRPYFFSILIEENPLSLHIIVSSKQFENLSVNERIQLVLKLITANQSVKLNGNIVIEAFTANEIEDILDHL